MKTMIKFNCHALLLIFLSVLFLTACSSLRRPPPVRSYPVPDLVVDTDAFQQAGCPLEDSGRNVCPPESELGRLGCDFIAAPGNFLGGLQPSYPINLCWEIGAGGQFLTDDQYIYRDGCMLPLYARYVILRDGDFQVLGNLTDLQKVFAPITSEDEALSYAIAATGLSAFFGLQPSKGFRYFVDRIEDSHAKTIDQGYLVYLYDYQFCGCGPHTTSYVEVLIKPDGSVMEQERIPVYEDPEEDNLCID